MLNKLVTIDKNKLTVAEGKVVKAHDFTQLIEAQEVVAAARKEANQIKATVDDERIAARQSGYEDGMQVARAEFAASVVEATAKMEAAFVGLEMKIINTVMNAVRQILGDIDDNVVMERIVRRVLADARAKKSVRLRVAAEQFDEVNELLASILSEFPDIEVIDVVKDPNGTVGTCVLESEFGVIDASVETQLAVVRAGLVKAFITRRQTGDLSK